MKVTAIMNGFSEDDVSDASEISDDELTCFTVDED